MLILFTMNRIFGLMLLVITALTSCRGKVVRISGILEHPAAGKYVFLDELKSDKVITVDSVMLSGDGSFEMKIKIKNPAFYQLKINQNNLLTMLLEPGEKIKFTSHYDSLNYPIVITGSMGTSLMAEYNRNLRNSVRKMMSLNKIYEQNPKMQTREELIDSLDRLAHGYLNEINLFTRKYIDDNIGSLATLAALYQQISPNLYVLNFEKDIDYFKKVDSSLYSKYPDYDLVVTLHNQVEKMLEMHDREDKGLKAAMGGDITVPEISLPSPGGDTVKLSSTRGMIVLLDFWASWCSPCRRENPNLVKAYNMYRDKGFQIYQVSLDKTREAWLKGIEEDQLEKWIHVSDVKYWNSVVVSLYKIESIPANFLLDREGKVLASDLRGDELLTALSRIFDEQGHGTASESQTK